MSDRRVSYLAIAAMIVALAAPTAVLAITPVDQTGRSAPSEPQIKSPSPSNEATSGSSTTHGIPGSSAASGTGGAATGATSNETSSDQLAKARGKSGSGAGATGGQIDVSGGTHK